MGRRAPSGLRFFFDANFPPGLARALGELDSGGNEYRSFRDVEWPTSLPDVEWIRRLKKDQIVVSGDLRILKNPAEVAIWLEAGLSGFFLSNTFPKMPLWQQATWLVGRWESVLKMAKRCRAGETYEVPQKGEIFLWSPGGKKKRKRKRH